MANEEIKQKLKELSLKYKVEPEKIVFTVENGKISTAHFKKEMVI